MIDKLKFNNLVISNKKGIQQSRIQTINKLVHKIRKLKTLLEKHPNDTKCKERIRKSTETIEILKKLKRVDIIKQVLLMDKPPAAVITNGLATPEEIAVALLSMNKVMLGLIKRFKTELQLNNITNDEWKQVLMESSKRKLKIERTEERRRKRLESKQQKSMGRKRIEWLEENQQNISESISFENDLNMSTTSGWQIEELSNGKIINETNEKIQNICNKKPKLTTEEKPNNNSTFLSNKKQKVSKKPESRKFEEEEFLEESEKKLNTPEDALETESNNETEGTGESLVVDPFFITDNGENYLSAALSKRDNRPEETSSKEKRDLHMIKLNSYDKGHSDFHREQRHLHREKNPNKFEQIRREGVKKLESNVEHEKKWNVIQIKRGETHLENKRFDKNHRIRQDSRHIKSLNSDEQKLHPSWAAKQKLKPIITEFQGKKITFDDRETKPRQENNVKTNQKAITPKSIIPADSIHPSWAAKQKLKPSITTFQGKKITFDNNE